MSKRQPERNFSITYDNSDWFVYAAGEEFEFTWGTVKKWEKDVPHLQFMRAQTCWLESDIDDLQIRRRSAYAIARAALSPNDMPDSDLQRNWPLLGVESVSPSLADSICTLYNESPVRTFGDEEADKTIAEAFKEEYTLAGFDMVMQHAYRSALFTNIVAIIPSWKDGLKFTVATPDLFRYQPKTDSQEEELWVIERDEKLGLFFRVYTPTCVKKYRDGAFVDEEPHDLGRLPAVLLKLTPSNDVYGAGMTEAAEINAWSNLIRFFSTRIGLHQAFSVGVASNMALEQGTRIGPGHIIIAKNSGADASTKPELTFVTPDGKFVALEDFRAGVVQGFQRNQGLPAFIIDMSGTPPTGIALQVMQRRLNEKRKLHKPAIRRAELEIATLVSKMGASKNRRLLFKPSKFGVEFVGETMADSAELSYDLERASKGLMAPTSLVQKYLGIQSGITEEQAATMLRTNRKFFAGDELKTNPKGVVALQELIGSYEAQTISRPACIALATIVYGFEQGSAELLFPIDTLKPTTQPTPTNG
jgi:hypothetical protein